MIDILNDTDGKTTEELYAMLEEEYKDDSDALKEIARYRSTGPTDPVRARLAALDIICGMQSLW